MYSYVPQFTHKCMLNANDSSQLDAFARTCPMSRIPGCHVGLRTSRCTDMTLGIHYVVYMNDTATRTQRGGREKRRAVLYSRGRRDCCSYIATEVREYTVIQRRRRAFRSSFADICGFDSTRSRTEDAEGRGSLRLFFFGGESVCTI